MNKRFNYKAIAPGYPWTLTLRVNSTPGLFPEGVKLRAQVREAPDAPLITTLSTEDGSLARYDDQRIVITLDPEQTNLCKRAETVTLDLVRTDTPEPRYLGIRLRATVQRPVTVPAEAS